MAGSAFIGLHPSKTMQCPSCGNAEITADHSLAELYCAFCGHVLEEQMPFAADLIGVKVSEYDTRVFEAVDHTLPNKGRNTVIPGMGLSTNPGKMYNMINLSDKTERSFSYALPSLNFVWMHARRERIFHKHVAQTSAIMYRKCIKAKLVRGRNPDVLALAVFHAAMEAHGYRHDMEASAEDLEIDEKMAERYLAVVNKIVQNFK